ncbi:MAG: glycosyltransferase family 2 protein, partial [Thermodesulfovibrionia bacterium]|nr:glycosyltransferase family 2 protein [Thermodesulfovibrionia bacterium]
FKYTDLGPFRAIKFNKLLDLNLKDNWGWTPEMQVKAAKRKFKIVEVPVKYRKGSGKSKITGNIKGIMVVGYRILWVIFKCFFQK